MSEHGVSVVVPVYQSAHTLEPLVDRIRTTLSGRLPFEIIMVDDGSAPSVWSIVQRLAHKGDEVTGLRLGRNYGQHNALVAGVRAARYEVVVTLDDDLQNPPEEIPKLLDCLVSQDLDVVYGVPEHVGQSFSRRTAGRITKLAMRSGLGMNSAPDVSSFRAFRTQVRDAFAGDLGTNVSLDALLTWGAARFGSVPVEHSPRSHGKSNYSLVKLVRFAVDTMTGYSAVPLQIASVMGLLAALFGLMVLAFAVGRPLVTGDSVPGFPFLASIIAIFSGVQLFTLGVIGEYLARMHFRVMRKPTYVIAETARSLGLGVDDDPVQ